MDNKLIQVVIAITVGIVVLGSLLVPVITDATSTEKTFTNVGYFTLDKIDSSDDTTHTLAWSSSNSKIIKIDDTDLDMTTWGLGSYQQVTVFATETDLFRLGVTSGTQGLSWIQIRGATIGYAQANTSFTATIGGGSVSIQLDSEASPRTLSYSDAYLIAPGDGEFVMKKSTESAYLNADSPIYGLGYTGIAYDGSSVSTVLKIDGTIESMTAESIITTDPEITTSDIVVDAPEVSGYIDLYSFSQITFTATMGTDTTNCVYSYVIVPKEVTAELSQHLDASEIGLLAVIPVLMIVAFLVFAVRIFGGNRD